MTPEEMSAVINEMERKADEARQKLYKAIGREAAYMLLGAIIGGAIVAFLGFTF
jgi:hypothetical protein